MGSIYNKNNKLIIKCIDEADNIRILDYTGARYIGRYVKVTGNVELWKEGIEHECIGNFEKDSGIVKDSTNKVIGKFAKDEGKIYSVNKEEPIAGYSKKTGIVVKDKYIAGREDITEKEDKGKQKEGDFFIYALCLLLNPLNEVTKDLEQQRIKDEEDLKNTSAEKGFNAKLMSNILDYSKP